MTNAEHQSYDIDVRCMENDERLSMSASEMDRDALMICQLENIMRRMQTEQQSNTLQLYYSMHSKLKLLHK